MLHDKIQEMNANWHFVAFYYLSLKTLLKLHGIC